MNISELSNQLASMLSKAGSMFLSAGDDFGKELMLGQIIKGKALRSYDGGRYLVAFGGHEKVVDSSVPLKNGETIHGRVVNVGDKVELQRVINSGENNVSAQGEIKAQTNYLLGNKWEGMLRESMLQFNAKFSAAENAMITRLMKNATNPLTIAYSAIALSKQGIVLSEQVIQLLTEMQNKNNKLSMLPIDQSAPQLGVADSSSGMSENGSLTMLVSALMKLVEEQQLAALRNNNAELLQSDHEAEPSKNATDGNEFSDSDHNREFVSKWRLLNSQIDGAVQHSVNTLPIWLGGKLIEVNVAIYEQRGNKSNNQTIDSKKIIFSLELDTLGHIDIEMLLENKNLRLKISSDSHKSTQDLLSHGSLLTDDVADFGWSMDEISYMTKNKDDMNNVVSSVIEHYVSQDSLSRLM
jgi:hypothetical protein